MRWIAVVMAVVMVPAIASAAPWSRGDVGPLAPAAAPSTFGPPGLRAVDPQAGEAWGGDLAAKLDEASGRTWKSRVATVQIGYQQRDFAPSPPAFDSRGYEHMLKDAPDMAGFSLSLRTR